jgi:hypothetical protein
MMIDQLMESVAKRPECVTNAAESLTGINSTVGKTLMLSLPFKGDCLKV